MKKIFLLCFPILIFVIFISGCASQQFIQRPTSSLPEPGLSRISLKRQWEYIGGAAPMIILDNDRIVGQVRAGGNLVWDRPPGTMHLSIKVKSYGSNTLTNPLTVNVISGFLYHLQVKRGDGWSVSGICTLVGSERIRSDNYYTTEKKSTPPIFETDSTKSKTILTPTEAVKDRAEGEKESVSAKVSTIGPDKNEIKSLPSVTKEMPKIVVWNLSPGNIPPTYAQDLTSILVSEIAKFKKYEVISQENIQTIAGWTEERMKLGCTDTKCLMALGQMDISKLISGRVGRIGNTYSISLHLFDTQRIKADNSISEECRSEDDLIPLVRQTVGKLLRGEVVPSKAE